jgi:hypothetical protein
MASQKGSPSHSLSGYSANELDKLRTYKPTKWYKNLLSQSQHKALYNEKLLTQEYEPDPNWKCLKSLLRYIICLSFSLKQLLSSDIVL